MSESVASSILAATAQSCEEDLNQYCLNGFSGTYNSMEQDKKTQTQGGYSNVIVVDENYVLKNPNESSARSSSSTPLRRYHALLTAYALESGPRKNGRDHGSRRLGPRRS